jgi:hypothetical protein
MPGFDDFESFPVTLLKQHHLHENVFLIDREHPEWNDIRVWLQGIDFDVKQSGIINIWCEIIFKDLNDAMRFKLTFC